MRRRTTSGRFYLALVLTVVLVFLLAATSRLGNGALGASAWLGTVVGPVEGLGVRALTAVTGATGYVEGLFRAENRVQALQHEVQNLKSQLVYAQAQAAETQHLQKLLGLAQSASLKGREVAADVTGRAPATWFDTVTIDRGTSSGVQKGDPVLAGSGLAGRVLAASPYAAVVLLLPDPQSAIGAMDSRTRDVGVISGSGNPGTLDLQFYSGTAGVAPGDTVISSGLAGRVPKGLAIGTVVKVGHRNFGLVEYATVAPFVNFDRLEAVLVVVGS